MAIQMIRIDDRLIHGQVVVGWCPHLRPDRIILCDDEIAQSEWERQVYCDAAAGYKASVCTVRETQELVLTAETEREKILIIVESPKVAFQLLEGPIGFSKIIVGGMHHAPGKRSIASFIYIDDEDLNYFQRLRQKNITIEGRDVPTCKPIDIVSRLGLS
jgi:PTS system mannose-specific IIB component